MAFILLNSSMHLTSASGEYVEPTDIFHDVDCRDAKSRILELAQSLIAGGWTYLRIGFNPVAPMVSFMFAIEEGDIGDLGRYRYGHSEFDKCDDPEFQKIWSLIWNPQTNSWETITSTKSEVVSIDWKTLAIAALLAVVVIGLIYIYIYSGGMVGGSGPSCPVVKVVPSYNGLSSC